LVAKSSLKRKKEGPSLRLAPLVCGSNGWI
jgi:hypothetical protein